jgi:phosphate-selective porin OprO/OprP
VIQNRIVRVATLFASLTLAATSAQAAEEQSLGDLLVEKGYISADELESVEQEAKGEQPPVAAGPAASEPAKEESGVTIRADKKGLAVESADGKFVFAFGGRLQADAAVFIDDESSLGDGYEIRRARIKSYGTVWRDWNYKLEVNFDTNGDTSLTDAWIEYAGFEPFAITVGNQKVPFGQQSMTSSNYQVFQERGLPDAFIDTDEEGRRRMGVVFSSYGEHWNAAGGFFGGDVDGGSGSRNSDWGTAGRAVWAPLAEKTKVLTFGSSINYRKFESQPDLVYESRPEAHLAGVKMVDTGTLSDAKDTLEWNLESSLVLGQFHAQAEYTGSEVTRKRGMKNLSFGGWYVQSGVFLTGESRNYDIKSGQYKAITPLNSYGAWELAARYSSIDLDDNGVKGGKEDDVTVAVNWWVNTNILIRFNYVYADISPTTDAVAISGSGQDQTAHAFTGRAQIVF